MEKRLIRIVFAIYLLVTAWGISRHELWGDEVHSWNISKGSGSYSELIANRRFEGHPPGWYTICWTISRFTHNMAWMQFVQWLFAGLVAWLILFRSPYPLLTKVLLPFGYFFVYEYAVFSRNYIIGIFLIFCICRIMRREFRYKEPVYYLLLFLASNFHLLALLLAASLHGYFLLLQAERGKSRRYLAFSLVGGVLVFLPAVRFIFPPSDSALNIHVWLDRWSIHQLTASIEAPLRSFLPVPAWWNYHFWNTEVLVEAKKDHAIFKVINLIVATGLVVAGGYILRRARKPLLLYAANLVLNFALAIGVMPLTVTRYAGFIFLGFLAAWWLYCEERPVPAEPAIDRRLVNSLLGLHILAGVFALVKDIRLPFANLYRVNECLSEVPAGGQIVTDYWTMNAMVAYTDKPAYCIDMGKEISYVLWDPDVAALQKNPCRYASGLHDWFGEKRASGDVYMLSLASPQVLTKTDSLLYRQFRVDLIDSRQGAIEKGSDLYLYRISRL